MHKKTAKKFNFLVELKDKNGMNNKNLPKKDILFGRRKGRVYEKDIFKN